MQRRRFPSQKDAHERAHAHDKLTSIEPEKMKVQFQVRVVDEDIYFGSPRKNTHQYQLKKI